MTGHENISYLTSLAELHPIKTREIIKTQERMGQIISQMRPNILNGEYSVVVSDERSGRIPAMIMWNVMRLVSEKNGYEAPKVVLFKKQKTSDKEWSMEATSDNLVSAFSARTIKPGKALFVTEFLKEGISMAVARRAFEGMGRPMEVAALQAHYNNDYYSKAYPGVEIFLPYPSMRKNPLFVDRYELLGLPQLPDVGFEEAFEQAKVIKKDIKSLAERMVGRFF